MTGPNRHNESSSRRHPRTHSRTNANGIRPEAPVTNGASALTPRAMQAHDLQQMFNDEEPSHLLNKRREQAQVTETSLASLGIHLPPPLQDQVIDNSFGMSPVEHAEASLSYPLQTHNGYEPFVGDQSNGIYPTSNGAQDFHTQTQTPHPNSSTHVQHNSSYEESYPYTYPYPQQYTQQDNQKTEEHYSSPSQNTYTNPPNTDPTHWGHPLSGTGTQFPSASQSQDPYAQTINGYINSQG